MNVSHLNVILGFIFSIAISTISSAEESSTSWVLVETDLCTGEMEILSDNALELDNDTLNALEERVEDFSSQYRASKAQACSTDADWGDEEETHRLMCKLVDGVEREIKCFDVSRAERREMLQCFTNGDFYETEWGIEAEGGGSALLKGIFSVKAEAGASRNGRKRWTMWTCINNDTGEIFSGSAAEINEVIQEYRKYLESHE